MNQKKGILILTSDAGFGHRSVSNALSAAFKAHMGDDVQVSVINPMHDAELPNLIKRIETDYDDTVSNEPGLYQLMYNITNTTATAQMLQNIAMTGLLPTITKIIAESEPSVVVIPYPGYTQAVIRAMDDLERQVPIDVVVTDLVAVHKLWFHRDVDLTFVPTGQVYRQALRAGLHKRKIELLGLPVHPRISLEVRDAKTLRRRLGWDIDKITIMVVGSPRGEDTTAIIHLLDHSGLNLQLVGVCGGDEETYEELVRSQWESVVHIYDRVKNMPELMKASDVIVCKAGGLIVAEALACGLPLILSHALPGQELGNVRYVVESGAGTWSPGPIGVLTTLYDWIASDNGAMESHRQAAQKAGKSHAAFEVVDRIIRQLQ